MDKINKITTDGNNNVTLQDVSGQNITINMNDTTAIENLIKEHSGQLTEIKTLLANRQEPALQELEKKLTIVVTENRTSKYVKYVLLFFALPAAFMFLMYWYFVLSKPFTMTITPIETVVIPNMPFESGILRLQYGDKTEELEISKEVIFKQIPANLKGKTAQLHFSADGYIPVDTLIELSESFQLPIIHDNSLCEIFGMVKDEENKPLKAVTISVKGIKIQTDELGFFRLKIPYEKQAEEQRLTAYKDGYELWDRTFPVIKDVETKIILRE